MVDIKFYRMQSQPHSTILVPDFVHRTMGQTKIERTGQLGVLFIGLENWH